jgi:hypothetical protein
MDVLNVGTLLSIMIYWNLWAMKLKEIVKINLMIGNGIKIIIII